MLRRTNRETIPKRAVSRGFSLPTLKRFRSTWADVIQPKNKSIRGGLVFKEIRLKDKVGNQN
jgi:hypothetical protein